MRFRVNGLDYDLNPEADRLLVDLLREGFGLTGTKRGCEDGSCGACTVLVEGEPRHACLTLARRVSGKEITTIEGVSPGRLSNLQRSLVDSGGLQCGFCAPGMILTAVALLRRGKPTRDEVREAISGNFCRCTGYAKIIEAIERAAEEGPTP